MINEWTEDARVLERWGDDEAIGHDVRAMVAARLRAVATVLDALGGGTTPPTVRPDPAPAQDGEWIDTAEAARRLSINRSTLDEMRDRAPKNLPGSPVVAGLGTTRRHWRWEARRLQEWFQAYQAWRLTRGRRGR